MFKGPIALSTIRTSFVLGLRLLIQAGTFLLVARMLGPEEFGFFAGVAALAVLMGTLSTFGTNIVFFRELAKDRSVRNELLAYIIPTVLCVGFSLLAVYLLISVLFITGLGFSVLILLFIGLADVLLQPLFGLLAIERHAQGRVARAQLLHNMPLALRMLIAGLVLYFQFSDALLVYSAGYLCASVLSIIFAFLFLVDPWPRLGKWHLPSRADLADACGYAASNFAKSGPAELDKALALKLLSLEFAGVYAAASRVVGAITLPVTAMTLSALPRLFREGAAVRYGNKLLLIMYGATVIYTALLAFALWLLAPQLERLFGGAFLGVAEVVSMLAFAVPAISLRLVSGNIIVALGRPWLRVGYELLGLVLLLVFSVALVSGLGYQGMPYAIVLSEWFMAVAGIILLLFVRKQGSL